ncbi:MAG TPA: TIGR03435 family protein [Bryobacteraceae bacterium]|jgi:uncharacterized protein (TIGR03435 family)
MRAASVLTGIFLIASMAGLGQPAPKEEFEAASVKLFTPAGAFPLRTDGGPGTSDPGRITYLNLSFQDLLMAAYGVKRYQISGPEWLGMQRYVITATIRPGATKEQVNQMLRNLLADRFKLALHRESRPFPVYELVVAKNGPKMKESVAQPTSPQDADPPAAPPRPTFTRDQDGFMRSSGGWTGIQGVVMAREGVRLVWGGNQTMAQLADYLSTAANPVIDKTGLTAKYDFSMQYARSTAAAPADNPPSAPDLLTAIQEQLGLRLNSTKGPLEFLVIEHAERTPAED